MRNKTYEEVQKEYEAVKKELVALQSREMRLSLLQQVQRQGVTRPEWTWFMTGNGK